MTFPTFCQITPHSIPGIFARAWFFFFWRFLTCRDAWFGKVCILHRRCVQRMSTDAIRCPMVRGALETYIAHCFFLVCGAFRCFSYFRRDRPHYRPGPDRGRVTHDPARARTPSPRHQQLSTHSMSLANGLLCPFPFSGRPVGRHPHCHFGRPSRPSALCMQPYDTAST